MIALANANIDFSLVEIEAPLEYKKLGSTLTKSRQVSAESGLSHMTARRLGSLFEEEIPQLPDLLRSYGQHASKIANTPTINSKGSGEHGPSETLLA